MEGLLPLAVCCLALVSSSLALRSASETPPGAAGRVARLVTRRALAVLRALSRTRLVDWVLSTGPGSAAAREMCSAPLARGLGVAPDAAAAALVAGVLLSSALAGLLFLTPLASIVVGATLCALVAARDAAGKRRRRRETLAEMPGIYRTLSVAMASGQTLAQAVEYVGAHERGPAAEVFARMSLRLRCGVSTEDAVALLAGELDVPGSQLLAAALVISHRTGSPLRDLLLRSARLAERQGEFERMLVVRTAQVRLSVRIVCLLPVVMVGTLTLVSPDFQQGLLTPAGMGCVAVAMGLDGVALALIRRIMRGVG